MGAAEEMVLGARTFMLKSERGRRLATGYTDKLVVISMGKSERPSQSVMRTKKSLWKRLTDVASVKRDNAVIASSGDEMEIKWGDIVNPTPENLLALLLTGLLGLAILQIFWQLFLVAVTITLAALKYSVIAAILLALLIIFL
ncbi:hypothetical protein GOP47_0014220 [Adiantum capillus-veneris]|uniref:Transmembrane protein n=1 Tax=Adiantum capillus-veneris TaxID=13818 RepID=A0A9D4UQI8_ADICA|nr:hypothetical protein GOP47_0014220 [Adiantum capillus-veneris]